MRIERVRVGEVDVFRIAWRLDSGSSPGFEAQALDLNGADDGG